MPEDPRAEYLETGVLPDGSIRSELDEVRELLGAPETWVEAPPEVAEKALADIRGSGDRTADGSPGRWLGFGGIAAAVFLVAALVMLWPSGTDVLLAGTDLSPQASGVATLDATGGGWSIKLDVDLPPADPGYYYEGWVWSDEGQGVSIGTFHLRNSNDAVTLWAGVDVNDYPSIWVSLQQEGAGPQLSDQIMLMGRLESSAD